MRERRSARERLPAFGQRGAFLDALAKQRVVVISGATGCGKSTQMPQYILEQARVHAGCCPPGQGCSA
jgi:HrpA-like RNA helicase